MEPITAAAIIDAITTFVQQRSISIDPEAKKDVELFILEYISFLNDIGDPRPLLLLQPHLRTVTQAALQSRQAIAANLHIELGEYLHNIGGYKEAKCYYQQALAIHRHMAGREHINTALTLNRLAILYESQGRYEQAKHLLQYALAIHKRIIDKEDSDTASILNNLGSVYYHPHSAV